MTGRCLPHQKKVQASLPRDKEKSAGSSRARVLKAEQRGTDRIRLAVPGSILDTIPAQGESSHVAYGGRIATGEARVTGIVSTASGPWVLIECDLVWPAPERTIEIAVALGRGQRTLRLFISRPDGRTATGLVGAARFQGYGCFAQAAAVWLDLAATRSVSPAILEQHLQRLAAELEARRGASPGR